MKAKLFLIFLLVIIVIAGAVYYLKQNIKPPLSVTPTPNATVTSAAVNTATPLPDTQTAIQAFLAEKYSKPLSEVKVTVNKEVPGFASGSVMFGTGGPGEGGMWLAFLGNGWQVVWDGNGNVDCDKMRQDYGFPDTILKPNFCD